jgi:hypothetical protein
LVSPCLCFAWSLRVAADDLDLVCLEGSALITFEMNVFDKEGPHVVAEAVGLEVALQKRGMRLACNRANQGCTAHGHAHFECEPCPDLVRQHLGNHAIEVVEDLHGQLGLDAAFVD